VGLFIAPIRRYNNKKRINSLQKDNFMKKMPILINIFLSLSIFSACAAYENFTDAHGATRKLRPAIEEDFTSDSPVFSVIEKHIANSLPLLPINNFKERCALNQAGIFIVETVEGKVIGCVSTGRGRMPLGYQPWPPSSEDDQKRSSEILSFYAALLESTGSKINPTKKHRDGSDIDLVHINPTVLALTIVLGGEFGTLSAQEAIVSLMRHTGMMIVEDPGVTQAGVPSLCVSITQIPTFHSTPLTTVYKGLPYYPATEENDGHYWVAVTPLREGVSLPEKYAIRAWTEFEEHPATT
jgi:hypothetical protein